MNQKRAAEAALELKLLENPHLNLFPPIHIERMSVSVRDASLTTLKRKQRALAAYRLSYATVNTRDDSVEGFPVGNTVRPEQPRYQTGDVPRDARTGLGLLKCCSEATDDGYGKQSPANIHQHNS